jgi:hypothetical protein
MSGSKTTAVFAIVAGAVAVTIGAVALSLVLDTSRVDAAAMPQASAPVAAVPDCGRACSSYVIAAPVAGEPAHVVSGVSAFGMALDPGAAIASGSRDGVRTGRSVPPSATSDDSAAALAVAEMDGAAVTNAVE